MGESVDIKTEKKQSEQSVLIVDDSSALRGALRAVLQAIGVERVIEAADALDAINILRSEDISLTITDWKMEPMDGLALVRAVREGAVGPNVDLPMIMLTAYDDARYQAQAMQAGVSYFLAKPFTATTLVEALDAVATTDLSPVSLPQTSVADPSATALQA